MGQIRKEFTKEQNQAIYEAKNSELDLLIDKDSKFIYSGNGKFRVLVDNDTNFDKSFKVRARRGYLEVSVGYTDDKKRVNIALGRLLLGIKNKSLRVDHRNKNPLDNRESNIRVCNQSQNLGNRKNYSSINMYKGYHKKGTQIIVQSQKNGIRTTYRLTTENEEYAATVYDCLAVINHGEFAETNFNIKNYTNGYISSILNPIEEFKSIETKYTVRSERDDNTESVSIMKLVDIGFIQEGDFFTFQIGNNVDLVVDNDLLYSVRFNWKDGDGVHLWCSPKTISELKTLIKILSNK